MKYRPMELEDLPNVIKFWKENYRISVRDTTDKLKTFLIKNENLSTVAIDDNEDIVGTVLASFDGRKGYIQKVVIKKDLQGQGYGKEMIKNTIEKLKKAGALDIRVGCSEDLVPFYEKCGFEVKNIISMQIKGY